MNRLMAEFLAHCARNKCTVAISQGAPNGGTFNTHVTMTNADGTVVLDADFQPGDFKALLKDAADLA